MKWRCIQSQDDGGVDRDRLGHVTSCHVTCSWGHVTSWRQTSTLIDVAVDAVRRISVVDDRALSLAPEHYVSPSHLQKPIQVNQSTGETTRHRWGWNYATLYRNFVTVHCHNEVNVMPRSHCIRVRVRVPVYTRGYSKHEFASIPTATVHINTGSVRVRVTLKYEQFLCTVYLFRHQNS